MLKQKYCQIKPTWWVCGAQFLSKYARCHRPYLPPRWLPSATGLRGLFAPPTTKRTGQKGTKKRTEERHSENTESLNKSTLKKKTWDGNRVFALTFALKRSIRWWCICYKFPHLTKRLSAQWLGILCCLWMTNQHFDRAKEMVFSMKFQFHIVLVLLKWCQRDTQVFSTANSLFCLSRQQPRHPPSERHRAKLGPGVFASRWWASSSGSGRCPRSRSQ